MATRTEHAARPNRESLSKRLGRVAAQIKARDGHACVYCGRRATKRAPLHLDHLTPRNCGGADVASNLVLACRACNCARHDLSLAAWLAVRSPLDVETRVAAILARAARPLPALAA